MIYRKIFRSVSVLFTNVVIFKRPVFSFILQSEFELDDHLQVKCFEGLRLITRKEVFWEFVGTISQVILLRTLRTDRTALVATG